MAMNPMAGMGRPPAIGGMPPSMGAAPMSQAPSPQMGGGVAPSTGNVMQITSTLRGMSDQQLQQYAAMHKSDPFVFPLAFQESQTRKQMRAGQAAQMAGQKLPPVVDQDLQQMTPTPLTGGAGQTITGGHGQAINVLPEEQGIGALNAPNLQRMADGGIAGYADGGQQPGMFNYAQMAPAVDLHPNSGVTPRSMAGGGITGYADAVATAPIRATNPGGPGGMQYYLDVPEDPSERVLFKTLRGKLFGNEKVPPELGKLKGQLFKTQEEAQTAYNDALGKKGTATATPAVTTPAKTEPAAVENKEPPSSEDVLAEPTETKAPWSPGIVAPKIATAGGIGGRAPTAEGAKQQANTFLNPETFKPDIENEITETGVGIAQQRALRDKMLAGRKTPYKDYEERLKAQEAKEPEEKEKLTGLSLLEAGLAVMGGDSPYAFQNLSRATAGVKTYSEGIKDLKKSKDLRDRAFADIEQARTAQANNDIDRSIEFEDRASGKLQEARRWGISSLQNFGMENAKIASHAYDNALNNFEANRRTASTNAVHTAGINAQLQMEANKLNMAPPEARMAMMLGNGDLETGLAKMAAIQAGKLNPTKEYLDYKAKAVGKVDVFGQPVPIQSASEFFEDLKNAQLALAAMGGPGKLKNTAPSVLRQDK